MAKMTTTQRAKTPTKDFAGPKRSFPLTNKSHDRAAISGATRSEKAGNISKPTEAKIKTEARDKLGERAPAGHEHLNASIHFGGGQPARNPVQRGKARPDGLPAAADKMKFIGG